jgi:DNA repair protein RecO (recombination protein O)
MEWSDEGIIVSAAPQGENNLVLHLLTRAHGKHAGLVHGGRSARQSASLQLGNRVKTQWRARLSDHLGVFSLEAIAMPMANILDDALRLQALQSACAVTASALPEREPHEILFDALAALLSMLESEWWAAAYVRWEIGLLAELGFPLALDRCAVTGGNDQLAFVSPRTGRAVSLAAAEPYRDRLLPLPRFLIDPNALGSGDPDDVLRGLELTSHFLERAVFAALHRPPPAVRERFVESYRRFARREPVAAV